MTRSPRETRVRDPRQAGAAIPSGHGTGFAMTLLLQGHIVSTCWVSPSKGTRGDWAISEPYLRDASGVDVPFDEWADLALALPLWVYHWLRRRWPQGQHFMEPLGGWGRRTDTATAICRAVDALAADTPAGPDQAVDALAADTLTGPPDQAADFALHPFRPRPQWAATLQTAAAELWARDGLPRFGERAVHVVCNTHPHVRIQPHPWLTVPVCIERWWRRAREARRARQHQALRCTGRLPEDLVTEVMSWL